jgi:hypothetical protein
MIKNVPSAERLTETSLRLYFTAWDQVTGIVSAMLTPAGVLIEIRDRQLVAVPDKDFEDDQKACDEALAEMLRLAQSELQLAYTLILQSHELALKARICSRSPYLLLLGTDIKQWAKPNADFGDFRTIDASDLVRVVNSIFPKPLSEPFVTRFEDMRRGRNKLIHLGLAHQYLDPIYVIDLLADQYLELYPKRNWLKDHAEFQLGTLSSHFFDKHWNERTSVLHQVEGMNEYLTKRQRYELLGIPFGVRIFGCPVCHNDARAEVGFSEAGTAFLVDGGDGEKKLRCRYCERDYKVYIGEERCPKCKCEVIFADLDFDDTCCSCGRDIHKVELPDLYVPRATVDILGFPSAPATKKS